MKSNGKKNKKILVLAILLLLVSLALIGIGVLNLGKDKNKNNVIEKINLDYKYLSVTDKGEYLISGADVNVSFEVTEGTNFKIVDEDNKEVKVKIVDNKIVNPEGYEKGKKYKLTIDNGEFVSEQLKDAEQVTFKIARDEVKKYKIKEDVIKVNIENIQATNDKLIIPNSSYRIGDVILVYNGEEIKEGYVITGVDLEGNYEIEDATLEQIYSEFDFYYEESADLSNYEVVEQIKEYVIASTKNSSWYNAIIETVHAEPKIELEFKNVQGGIEVEVKVKISAGDNSLILNSKYHDFEFSFKHTLQVKTLFDLTLDNWDVKVQVTDAKAISFKIGNKLIDIDKPINNALVEKIQDAINNKTNLDSDRKEFGLVVIPVPTPVPGLTFQIETGLVTEIEMTVSLEAGVSNTNVLTVGFDYGVGEDFKPSASNVDSSSEKTLKFSGKIEAKIGVKVEFKMDLVGLLEGGIGVAGGLYDETEVSTTLSSSDPVPKAILESTLGLFVEVSLEFEIVNIEFKYTLIEKKLPLLEVKTVNFDSGGGGYIFPQLVVKGNKVERPKNPTKEGYIFHYWEVDGERYNFNSKVSDSMVLTAVWKEIVVEEEEEEVTENEITNPGSNKELSNAKGSMSELNNYSYDVEMTTVTDYLDFTITMNCKEDVKNQIGYCSSSIYGVTTEQYTDYAKGIIYSKVSSPFGGDNNGEWTSSSYVGDYTNKFVGLSEYIANATKVPGSGGTYYNGTIDTSFIADAMSGVDEDVDSSSIIGDDIKISVFVNSSNYIEKTTFSMVVAGIQEDVVINYKDFDTTGSLSIPASVR